MRKPYLVVVLGAAMVSVAYAQMVSCFKSASIVHTVSSVDRSFCNPPGCGTADTCMDFYFRGYVDCTVNGNTSCSGCMLWELWYTEDGVDYIWDSATIGAGVTGCTMTNNNYNEKDLYRCEGPGYTYTSYAWIYSVPCNQVGGVDYADRKIVYFTL